MNDAKRSEKGLSAMWEARRASRKVEAASSRGSGRPMLARNRRIVHAALHAALMGMMKT